MVGSTIRGKMVKDLSVDELKKIIREVIAEDIQSWQETFEIMSNKTLMKQIEDAEAALNEGREDEFMEWDRVKDDV
jgi:hypothetical protein